MGGTTWSSLSSSVFVLGHIQVDDKIFCIHGGLSPDLNSMEQIRRILRPTDVPDTGLLCDVLWADPDPNIRGWAESDRGVSFTFGADIVEKFNRKHVSLSCRCSPICVLLNVGVYWCVCVVSVRGTNIACRGDVGASKSDFPRGMYAVETGRSPGYSCL
jgi:hypothetical protein